MKNEKLIREPFTKPEMRKILINNDIRVRGKRAFMTHDQYEAMVFHYPEVKKLFIIQLQLDF